MFAPITLGVGAKPHETLPVDVACGLGDQLDTNFFRGVPYKIWVGKKRPKFGAIWATLDFDREYLRKASTGRKTEQHLINYISSLIGRKNFW